MKRIHLHRRISALSAAFLLSACAFSNGVPAAAPRSPVDATTFAHDALLYVANSPAVSGVDILTLPHGKRVATISGIGYPRGVCADRSGHVWITALLHGQTYALYEFARGATTPLHTVHRKVLLGLCAVEPSGGVAVMTSFVGSAGAIEIWPPSLQGKPQVIEVPVFPASGAYDAQGNLYLTGVANSDPAFGVLPKGSTKFTWLRLSKRYDIAYGCVGWDGTYVTLGTRANGSIIGRLKVQGQIAKIASTVRLRGFTWYKQYAIDGADIAAQNGSRVALYTYPAGGKPEAVFSGFDNPAQIAVSEP